MLTADEEVAVRLLSTLENKAGEEVPCPVQELQGEAEGIGPAQGLLLLPSGATRRCRAESGSPWRWVATTPHGEWINDFKNMRVTMPWSPALG